MQPTLYSKRNRNSSGFTLIEIAIVLVIIGLLLGGVLKGQELINSARVKNLAGDFKNVPVFIYGYQDRFRAVPGDDMNAAARVSGVNATTPANTQGNGAINGVWDSTTPTDETILFWQHIRLAGLTSGSTTAPPNAAAITAFAPQNSAGGRVGVSSISPIIGLTGSYFVCSSGIDGRLVTQLDATLDDGVSNTGLVQARANNDPPTTVAVAAVGTPVTGTPYVVCVGI